MNKYFKAMCTVATFSGISIIGFVGAWWHTAKMTEQETLRTLNQSVQSVEVILGHAAKAAMHAQLYREKPCAESALTDLRKIVAETPDVRSVSLMRRNIIYCSSVFGQSPSPSDPGQYAEGRLLLMNGNKVTPYRSILVFRDADKQGNGVLVGIDGYYIFSILKNLRFRNEVFFNIDNQFMNENGKVFNNSALGKTLSQESSKFGFSIDTLKLSAKDIVKSIPLHVLLIIVTSAFLLSFLMHKYLLLRDSVEYRLRRAMVSGEIYPVIQPIVEAKTDRLLGGEVLLRWTTSKGIAITPDQFIPVAESSGLIKQLTSLAFEQVRNYAIKLDVSLQDDLTIFFNVSSANFSDNLLLEQCIITSDALRNKNIFVGIEITERILIEESNITSDITGKLISNGIRIALDDFGTGNANYSYVKQFRPEFLKIDKAFTRNVDSDLVSGIVVRNMISLAREIDCMIIAEGVEEDEQRNILSEMGVDYIQGFLISRPVSLVDFFQALKKYKNNTR